MTSPTKYSLVAFTALFALAACQSPFARNSSTFSSVPPAPAGTVEQSELPPPTGLGQEQFQNPANVQDGTAVASQPPTTPSIGDQSVAGPAPGQSSNVLVGRTDLLGGWTLASDGDNCQLFISLTQWTGGYRATTVGCTTETLQGVSAWNLTGQTVSLMDGQGGQLARLAATTKTRFDGQTGSGAAVSIFR